MFLVQDGSVVSLRLTDERIVHCEDCDCQDQADEFIESYIQDLALGHVLYDQ